MALLRQCNVVVWGCETQQEQEVKDGWNSSIREQVGGNTVVLLRTSERHMFFKVISLLPLLFWILLALEYHIHRVLYVSLILYFFFLLPESENLKWVGGGKTERVIVPYKTLLNCELGDMVFFCIMFWCELSSVNYSLPVAAIIDSVCFWELRNAACWIHLSALCTCFVCKSVQWLKGRCPSEYLVLQTALEHVSCM